MRLDAVPLRDASLGPAEILMSESQERMMAIVEPAGTERCLAICARWDVQATVIGEVTGTGRLEMTWHGEQVVDIPPGSAADDGPRLPAPGGSARPAQDRLQADDPARLARPGTGPELRAALLAVLAAPDAADKAWVTEQYDRYVRGDTVLAAPHDAGLVRVDEATGLGVALATDGNGRYALLDPYAGAQLALAEAYRNVAVTGARPLAVTNCLNFGSPEDPSVMWQFTEAVRGLADACAALSVPVTGGNVSFYNQTAAAAIHPTPVVGVLGVHDDVRRRLAIGFGEAGAPIVLLGRTARGVRRLAVGARRARAPWRPAARRRPGRRTGPRRAARRRGWREPARGGARSRRRRPGRRACRMLPGGRHRARWCGCRGTRSAACSASPPRVRWLPSGLAARTNSVRCASGTGARYCHRDDRRCRAWRSPGCSLIPLAELADAHRGTLPRLFGQYPDQNAMSCRQDAPMPQR